jgi:hypothetical protein
MQNEGQQKRILGINPNVLFLGIGSLLTDISSEMKSKVTYCSKDGKQEKVFDALEWLAAMGSHVPNKAE